MNEHFTSDEVRLWRGITFEIARQSATQSQHAPGGLPQT